jgi:hypothetical protein
MLNEGKGSGDKKMNMANSPGQIIFEFVTIGNSIRACAMDTISLKEVVIVVARNTPEIYIRTLLIRKLNMRTENEKE